MQRKIEFSIGEYYHIYNRGTEKRAIFIESKDYKRFKILLYLCNSSEPVDMHSVFRSGSTIPGIFKKDRGDTLVDIGAYCLMPNHFHILIREKIENGISKFTKKLLTAYSMYFNNKNTRKGTLFEGSFQAKHVDSDIYLKYLFAYIHLNPVKLIDSDWKEKGIKNIEEAKEHLNGYQFSSFLDYKNISRLEEKIINKKSFPEYFCTQKDFNSFINEWLILKSKNYC